MNGQKKSKHHKAKYKSSRKSISVTRRNGNILQNIKSGICGNRKLEACLKCLQAPLHRSVTRKRTQLVNFQSTISPLLNSLQMKATVNSTQSKNHASLRYIRRKFVFVYNFQINHKGPKYLILRGRAGSSEIFSFRFGVKNLFISSS